MTRAWAVAAMQQPIIRRRLACVSVCVSVRGLECSSHPPPAQANSAHARARARWRVHVRCSERLESGSWHWRLARGECEGVRLERPSFET